MFEWLTGQKWVVVKTFQIGIRYGYTDGRAFIHLHESNKGKRKLSFTASLSIPGDKLKGMCTRSEIYNTRIYRWLSGRIDPEISTYNTVPEEDTANALRGKI